MQKKPQQQQQQQKNKLCWLCKDDHANVFPSNFPALSLVLSNADNVFYLLLHDKLVEVWACLADSH